MLIDCSDCNARVDGEVFGSVDLVNDPDVSDGPRRRVSLLRCPVCGNPLVAVDTQVRSSEPVEIWSPAERVWPSSIILSSFIPYEIRNSLEEADKCMRAGAFTASVVMTGRALEAMCHHFNTKGQTLAGGLRELLDREIIDKRLHQWGDELRLNRNLAAHATGKRFHAPDADALLTFALAICNYVFVLNEEFARFIQGKGASDAIMKQLIESLRAKKGKEEACSPPKSLWTLGHQSRRTQFRYEGSITEGCRLLQTGRPSIGAGFLQAALEAFRGREVKGGFKEDDSPVGSFGEWVQNNSKNINGRRLTPRHASFIAAILCYEAGVTSRLDGASVWLKFPDIT